MKKHKIKISIFVIVLFLQITCFASDKITNKILSSSVLLFKKNAYNEEVPIGIGAVVDNGNILFRYSSISPYESIIPNTNGQYSIMEYTDIDSLIIKSTYYNNKVSTSVNKVISFDKSTNLVLVEPKDKIGIPVRVSDNHISDKDLYSIIINYNYNYNNSSINLDILTKISVSNLDNKLVSIKINQNIDNDLLSNQLQNVYQITSFFYNKNSQLVDLDIPLNKYNYSTNKDTLIKNRSKFNEAYSNLLIKNNGSQFDQFYIEEQYNLIHFRSTNILFIDSICKRLNAELGSIKEINYFNSIEKYEELKNNIFANITLFGSPTLYVSYADNLFNLGLKDIALYCLYISLQKDANNIYPIINPYKSLKYCKWLLEQNQFTVTQLYLQELLKNNTNDWRVLSEIYLLLSYSEIGLGNIKDAEFYKNKSIEYGILFYQDYDQYTIDVYKYVTDKLSQK